MLDYALPALVGIFSWPGIGFLMLGSMIGLIFGVIPGLGGTQALALLLPLTFGMDSNNAVVLMIGVAGAVSFGGSISAILINTPGTAANACTVYDGFPMAKQGKAAQALGCSASSSALGGIFGAVVLTVLLPIGRMIVLLFSYPEMFMMAAMGLSIVAVLARGAVGKSFIAGGLGILISSVGFDPISNTIRYTLGIDYLWDGLRLVPVVIGLFALAEAFSLMTKKGAISDEPVNTSLKGMFEGMGYAFKHFGLFIRSSVTGTIVGIIPGIGGPVANFLAYGQAVATSKNKENFGKGDPRGLVASESSNNAKDGGALVPTLLFGVPGSLEMAVFLTALIFHGIQPGPRLILEHADTAVFIIYALVLSNIIVALIGLAMSSFLTRVTKISTSYIGPVIMMIALVGAYITNQNVGDIIVVIVFGVLGYAMSVFKYPRVPLIIGLVLGSLVQTSYWQTMDTFGPAGFFVRPISLGIFIFTVIVLVSPSFKQIKSRFFGKTGRGVN